MANITLCWIIKEGKILKHKKFLPISMLLILIPSMLSIAEVIKRALWMLLPICYKLFK